MELSPIVKTYSGRNVQLTNARFADVRSLALKLEIAGLRTSLEMVMREASEARTEVSKLKRVGMVAMEAEAVARATLRSELTAMTHERDRCKSTYADAYTSLNNATDVIQKLTEKKK